MESRARRSREEWAAIIKAWKASGRSRQEYCRSEGLSESTFRSWQGKLKGGREGTPGLVKIRGLQAAALGGRATVVRAPGIELRLSGEESEEYLGRLFRALRGA